MIIPPPRNCSAAGDSAYRKSSMNWNPPVSGLRRCQPPLARGPFGADWGLQAPKPPLPKGGGPPPKAVVEGFRFQEICRAGRPGPTFNYGSLRTVKSPPPGGGWHGKAVAGGVLMGKSIVNRCVTPSATAAGGASSLKEGALEDGAFDKRKGPAPWAGPLSICRRIPPGL